MVTKTDISYELELLENVSAADIESGHEDTINIWISGSGSSNTTSGYYRYLMQYKDKKKFEEKMISEATANQAYIHGAINAVKSIKKPCRICIIVPTSLGFEKAFRGKGVNVSLISTLYEEIAQKNCELIEARFINGADVIKKYIAMNAGNSSFATNMERKVTEKVDRVNQYKMSIYRECLGKVCDVLKDEGISEDIIYKVKEIKL